MTHFLVVQLRFARSELKRCLTGVEPEEAKRRLGPMNCISWIVGHLALQEHFYWVIMAQNRQVVMDLYPLVGYGQPPSQPELEVMWSKWDAVTEAADDYLATLTPKILETHLTRNGKPNRESVGTMLLRNIHHYWFHTGEAHAIRQMLGHQNLPDFVGNMGQAGYYSE